MEIISDVQAAESSPAIEIPRDQAGYAEWRQTGKLPEGKPKKAEAAASSDETSDKLAPASEAGNHQERKPQRDTAATRLNELLDDLRTAGLTPAELKTFKREAQKEATEQKPEKTENPVADPDEPQAPKEADFEKWDEFRTAEREYFKRLAQYEFKKAADTERRQQADKAARESLHTKMQDAKGRYGDEAIPKITETARTIGNDKAIPQVIKAVLDDSDVMVDLLYTLGSDSAALQETLELMRTNPGKALRKIVLLEKLVADELDRGHKAKPETPNETETPERDGSGKFVGRKETPEDKGSKAPPPPREVSGRGTAPPDEIDGAVKNGDVRRYFRAANARDIAQRRKG